MDYTKKPQGLVMGSVGFFLIDFFLLLFGIVFTIFCAFWALVELGLYSSIKQNRLSGKDDFVYSRFATAYVAMLFTFFIFLFLLMWATANFSSASSYDSLYLGWVPFYGDDLRVLCFLVIFGGWLPPTGIYAFSPQKNPNEINRGSQGNQKCKTCGCYFENRDISRGLQKAAGIGVMSVALPITFLTGGATAFLFGLLPGTGGASLYGSAGDNPELCPNCRS